MKKETSLSTCAILYDKVFRYFGQNDYRITNSFIYNWESDFFCRTKSGYTIEVEIKVSRSDFFADFKKTRKHYLLQSHKLDFVSHRVSNKLVDPKLHIPNRFYYAMPRGLVKETDVPDYAGILWLDRIEEDWYGTKSIVHKIDTGKPAPLLHKTKQDLRGVLLEKFYWKSVNMRQEIDALKQQIKELKDESRQIT